MTFNQWMLLQNKTNLDCSRFTLIIHESKELTDDYWSYCDIDEHCLVQTKQGDHF